MRSAFVPSHLAHAIGAALVKMQPDQSIPQIDHLDEALGKADSLAVEAFLEMAAKRRQSYDNRGGGAE